MSTYHLILVFYKGKFHIAQLGQFGGHPSRPGEVILEFLNNFSNVAKLKTALNRGRLHVANEQELAEHRDDRRFIAAQARSAREQIDPDNKYSWGTGGVNNIDADTPEYRATRAKVKHLIDVEFNTSMYTQPSLSPGCSAQILSLVANSPDPLPVQLRDDLI